MTLPHVPRLVPMPVLLGALPALVPPAAPGDSVVLPMRERAVIHAPGGDAPIETLAIARYHVGSIFEQAWDRETHGDQWQRLAELISERNPKAIGLDFSETSALADGITHSIELYAECYVASWGGPVRIKLEEDAFFDGEQVRYIDGRQTAIHRIPRELASH